MGFLQRDQFNQQHQNKGTFYRPFEVNAHIMIGSENYLDTGMNFYFAVDESSQAYGKIVSCIRLLAKHIICSHILHKKIL